MMDYAINKQERVRRRALAGQARSLVSQTLPIEDADESSLVLGYDGFRLQIAFSELHPLMVLCLARVLGRPGNRKDSLVVNELNLKSVLGSHAVNTEAGCYFFRTAHWLDAELTKPRFLEILARGAEEAGRAYRRLAG
jgi:hypothetical protein